jgi:hypothetical protein
MQRTHRKMLVYNWVVSFQDNDNSVYMEYDQLKKYLTRKEMLALYNAVKSGKNWMTFSNPQIHQVVGV